MIFFSLRFNYFNQIMTEIKQGCTYMNDASWNNTFEEFGKNLSTTNLIPVGNETGPGTCNLTVALGHDGITVESLGPLAPILDFLILCILAIFFTFFTLIRPCINARERARQLFGGLNEYSNQPTEIRMEVIA